MVICKSETCQLSFKLNISCKVTFSRTDRQLILAAERQGLSISSIRIHFLCVMHQCQSFPYSLLLEFHTTLYLVKVFARKCFAFSDKKSKAIFSPRRRTKTSNNEFPFIQLSPGFCNHFGE